MQIKQVAQLLGVENKEVINQVEARREQYTAQGYRLAKKLTVSSSLDEELVKHLLASFDQTQLEKQEKEKEEADRRRREEEERQRAAEALRRQKEEEERRVRAEAARKAAEAELARRQVELARQREEAARKAAEAQAASPSTTPGPPSAPVAQAHPPSTPASPPSAPAPRMPRTTAPGAPPSSAPIQQRTHQGAPSQPGAPTGQGAGAGTPAGHVARGERRDRPAGGGEGQRRPATGDRRRPDAQAPQGGRPPRSDRPGTPGDAPGPGARRRKDEERPAREANLRAFVEGGLQTDVTDEYRRDRTRRKGPKTPAAAEGEKDWTADRPRKAAKPIADDGRKRIRPSQIFNLDAVTERRVKPKKRQFGRSGGTMPEVEEGPKVVRLQGDFTVGQFAEKIGVPATEIIKRLFAMGQMLTINQLLDPDKAEEIALDMEIEIAIVRESDESDIERYINLPEDDQDLQPRPPVVTVMGHVDHGKTSLLDRIRKADVAGQEFGGITQHIGAHNVSTPNGDIVFLDTPGHAAFTEMRSRGANVTDLVVLVVAANDGVMPQTVEAINHARAAGVPLLVAINKIDVDGSNPERVKQELMRYELVAEEFGGDTMMIPVSAITGKGIDTLLESILVQTEILELKANAKRTAVGTVVESNVDPLRGAMATILIEKGTLHISDCFVCGTEFGRVRAMRDDRDQAIKEAGPGRPVEILGLRGSPAAGETFVVVPSEMEARAIAERRMDRRKLRSNQSKTAISLENLADQLAEGEVLTLNLIIKGDVQGSIEAIAGSLQKIKSDKVLIKILHMGVGAVNSSDLQLADASRAIVIAFNVSTDPAAKALAEETGVDVRTYQIIYSLLEDIEKSMVGMLAPEFEEKEEGRATVLQTFKVSKFGTVAGCFVEEGTIASNHKARLIRGGSVIWRGKVRSLRRVKDDVKTVQSGLECGIALEGYNDVKEHDVIEFYSMVEQEATLVSSEANKKPESVGT